MFRPRTQLPVVGKLNSLFASPIGQTLDFTARNKITSCLENALHNVITLIQPDGFIEVGAYEADFSRRMHQNYPDADVLAIEANPRVFEHFSSHVEADGVKYIHAACTSFTGNVTLHIPEEVRGVSMPHVGRAASLNELNLPDSEKKTTAVEVPAFTLDHLAKQVTGERLCVWMDVEGVAGEVILGGADTLKRSVIVYLETENLPFWKDQALESELTKRMNKAGFTLFAKDCQKKFQSNNIFIRTKNFDYLRHHKIALNRISETYLQKVEDVFSTAGN